MSQLSDIKNIKTNSSLQMENTEQETTPTTLHGDRSNLAHRHTILRNYGELKEHYPFSSIEFVSFAGTDYAVIRMIAVKKEIIDKTLAREEDFLGEYSRELFVIVPPDYQTMGCIVQGLNWLDPNRIPVGDLHLLYDRTLFDKYVKKGYSICIGAPESHSDLKNVILENVRTADHILTAYENFMRGDTERIRLFGLKHDQEGIKEYRKLKKGGRIKCPTSRNVSKGTRGLLRW